MLSGFVRVIAFDELIQFPMDRFVKISGVVSLFVLLFLSCAGKAPESGLKNDKFVREYEIVNHVEYRTGNAPLIISVPHDGPRTDDALVKRTQENCPDSFL